MSDRQIKSFSTREGPLREIALDIERSFSDAVGYRVFDDSKYVEISSNERRGVYVAFQAASSGDQQRFDSVMGEMAQKHQGRYEVVPADNGKIEGFLFLDRRLS